MNFFKFIKQSSAPFATLSDRDVAEGFDLNKADLKYRSAIVKTDVLESRHE